jgi:hypothetical protein
MRNTVRRQLRVDEWISTPELHAPRRNRDNVPLITLDVEVVIESTSKYHWSEADRIATCTVTRERDNASATPATKIANLRRVIFA